MASHCLVQFRSEHRAEPSVMLVCVPHAGAGPSVFRQWARLVPPGIVVAGIRLPGRESRISEPALTSMDHMVPAVVEELMAQDLPLVFYGHCFGAVLAFDVAAVLTMAAVPPLRLAVGSSHTPSQAARLPIVSDLPPSAFAAALTRIGQPSSATVLSLTEPAIRADFKAIETRTPFDAALSCPISAFRGADDQMTTLEEMEEWSSYTLSAFTLRELPAGHLLLDHAAPAVLAAIVADLTSDLCGVHPPRLDESSCR
jgi:surfactin synthase thioesterase subunit